MNKVSLTGRITRDPELKKTPNGTSTVSFTLAVKRSRRVEGQTDADFINCVVWGKQAETLNTYVKKGNMLGVTGRIQVRSYQNKSGKMVYVTEVVVEEFEFLTPKNNGSTYENTSEHNQYTTDESNYEDVGYTDEDYALINDIQASDLPF